MRNIELFETMFVQQQSSDEAHRKWYSQPEWYCANAYRSTQKIGSDILICKDPFGDKPVNEISKVLIAQGITDVILGRTRFTSPGRTASATGTAESFFRGPAYGISDCAV